MQDDPVAHDQQVVGHRSVPNNYPPRIRLTMGAERYLEQLGQDLVTGGVELHQLPPALLQFYVFAFEQGRASAPTQQQVGQAHAEADRLYAEVCRRIPPKTDWQSFAELSRIRGEAERAERAEQRAAYIAASIAAGDR